MNAATIIANLVAALDLLDRGHVLVARLRADYDAAKAAGVITAEQDAALTAQLDALRAKGFSFD